MFNTTGWKQLERWVFASSFRERSPLRGDRRRSAPTGRRFAPPLGTAHPLSYASGILSALAFLLPTPTLAEDSFLGTDNASFSGSVEIEGSGPTRRLSRSHLSSALIRKTASALTSICAKPNSTCVLAKLM